MTLICLSVHEGACTGLEGIEDSMAHEDTRDRCITASETFAESLNVGNDVFLLPCMNRPGPAHAAHDFVQDQQCAVFIANSLHCSKVARYCRHAS